MQSDYDGEAAIFGELNGRTILNVTGLHKGSERVEFECTDGSVFVMLHIQGCCENVSIEDVTGDVIDIVGVPLLMAEEASNSEDKPSEHAESWTWTFYKFRTSKGDLTIRWLGESNGYYSEGVDFRRLRSAGGVSA